MSNNSSNSGLVYRNGFVARPELKDTPKGPVFTFGLGMPESYEDDASIRFLNVEVWNEGLQQGLAGLTKGQKVAVEGYVHTREWEGKTYTTLRATRVGLVQFIERSKQEPAPKAAKTTVKKVAAKAAASPDELGF